MSEKIKIIVTVEGGVVTSVMAGLKLDVVIVDYDNINSGDPTPENLSFEDGFNVAEFMEATSTDCYY